MGKRERMKPERLTRELQAMANEAAEMAQALSRQNVSQEMKGKAERRLLEIKASRWRDRWNASQPRPSPFER